MKEIVEVVRLIPQRAVEQVLDVPVLQIQERIVQVGKVMPQEPL